MDPPETLEEQRQFVQSHKVSRVAKQIWPKAIRNFWHNCINNRYSKFCDHPILYRNCEGFLLTNSPYDPVLNDEELEVFKQDLNFEESQFRIYDTHAVTFCKKIPCLKELRAEMKRLGFKREL